MCSSYNNLSPSSERLTNTQNGQLVDRQVLVVQFLLACCPAVVIDGGVYYPDSQTDGAANIDGKK